MTSPAQSNRTHRVRSRALYNRILIGLALLAIWLGVWWGQAFITWLNATLL